MENFTEKVDYEGRAKNERDSYNWKEAGTRISFAIDKHLHCQIEGAMKAMLANANSIIVDGLEKACKIKLQEIASKLEVEVKSQYFCSDDGGNMAGQVITVWRWEDAPENYRALSDHGGDEDWVAVVPRGMGQPSWMEEGTGFGCCSVSEYVLPDGRKVFIGAHA